VKVAAPLNIPDRQLKDIILKKLPWILRKQEELRKICEESRLENKFADGRLFVSWKGIYFKNCKRSTARRVNLEENYIVVAADETKVSVNGPQYIRNVLKNFMLISLLILQNKDGFFLS